MERQARGIGIPPLAPQYLALARRQRTQEPFEIGVALILPVELHAGPLQPARLAQALPLIPRAKRDVNGRQTERVTGLFQRIRQRGHWHAAARPSQQSRTRNRTERRRDLQFRIIILAGPFQRVGPAMIEHILAVAVRLRIHRRNRDDRPGLVAQHRVLRQPPRPAVGRPAILHRAQEGVADERVPPPRARVPVGGIDFRDLRMERQSQRRRSVWHGQRPIRFRTSLPPQPPHPLEETGRRLWYEHDGPPPRIPRQPGQRRRSSPPPAA